MRRDYHHVHLLSGNLWAEKYSLENITCTPLGPLHVKWQLKYLQWHIHYLSTHWEIFSWPRNLGFRMSNLTMSGTSTNNNGIHNLSRSCRRRLCRFFGRISWLLSPLTYKLIPSTMSITEQPLISAGISKFASPWPHSLSLLPRKASRTFPSFTRQSHGFLVSTASTCKSTQATVTLIPWGLWEV